MSGRVHAPGAVTPLHFFLDRPVNAVHKYDEHERRECAKTRTERSSRSPPRTPDKAVGVPLHKQIRCRHTDNGIYNLL